MSCEACLRQHKDAWNAAVQHSFLKSCQQDTIKRSQFDTWLVQDYLFVREFTRLAANLLTVAPYCDYEVLLGGLEALRDEIKWFQVSNLLLLYHCAKAHLQVVLASSGTSCQARSQSECRHATGKPAFLQLHA